MRTIKYEIISDIKHGSLTRIVIDGTVDVRARWAKDIVEILNLTEEELDELNRQIHKHAASTNSRIFD